MFLINKNGDSAIEVKQVDMCLEYDEETRAESEKIHSGIMEKRYNYGSTENARKTADMYVREYLSDKKPICRILVNGKRYYGDYDEVQGKIVFEEILNALKNESAYFDMREIEFKES